MTAGVDPHTSYCHTSGSNILKLLYERSSEKCSQATRYPPKTAKNQDVVLLEDS